MILLAFQIFSKMFDTIRQLNDKTGCTNRILEYLESISTHLTPEDIRRIEEKVVLQYCRGHLDAGTPVGTQTASICAEPITQSVLKSAHRAGIESSKSPLLVMFSAEPPIDTIRIRPLVSPEVALRYIMPAIKDAFSRFIVNIRAGANVSTSVVELNAYEMVMRGKSLKYFTPFKFNESSARYETRGDRTVLIVNSSLPPVSIRHCIEEDHNKVHGSIEWIKHEFLIMGDFNKISDHMLKISDYVDVNSMTTLNLKKVAEKFGLLTARVMCEYLLYNEYKYDRLTLAVLSGYFCGTGISRGIDNTALSDMGFFTSLMIAATESASRAASETRVYSNPSAELNACVALNLESSIAGSTAIEAGGSI